MIPDGAFLRHAGQVLAQAHARALAHVERYNWRHWARPAQLPPGSTGSSSRRTDWRTWVVMAGRGFGKTRTGAETVRDRVRAGRARRVALVAPTYDAGRKLMIEGDSGILAVSPASERPRWLHQRRELHWPNGAMGWLYTSDEPENLRGPQHDFAWCEELGAWRQPDSTWNNLQFGMRVRGPRGDHPQTMVTTTPRAIGLLRRILGNPRTEVTGGTTYENKENLDEEFLAAVIAEYEGTRLGEQELQGKLLGDTPGAMWKMTTIDGLRVVHPPDPVRRIVVAIDPAVADAEGRQLALAEQQFLAETGIVVAGRARCLCRNKEEEHAFVYDDLSGFYQPDEWAQLAVKAYQDHRADRIVAEVNNGGALVEATLRALGGAGAGRVAYKAVHAAKGKATRAEPVAALYEKGMVHHIGTHPKLEDQMTTWNPLLARRSPDRMDALVWALTELMLGPRAASMHGKGIMTVGRRI